MLYMHDIEVIEAIGESMKPINDLLTKISLDRERIEVERSLEAMRASEVTNEPTQETA